MSLTAKSALLSELGIKHVVVSADLDVKKVWTKIAKIFGYKPSIKIIEDEARGGHRLRVDIKDNVIEYGIWRGDYQVVAGMINSDCVKSVVDSAMKKIKDEFDLHESIRAKTSTSSIHTLSRKLAVAGVQHVVVSADTDIKRSALLEVMVSKIAEEEFKPLSVFVDKAWVGKHGFEIGMVISGKYNFFIDLVYNTDDVHVSVSGKGSDLNKIQGGWTAKNVFDGLDTVFALSGQEFKSFLKETIANVKHRCLAK